MGDPALIVLPVAGEHLREFGLLPDSWAFPVENVDGDNEQDSHEA